MPAALLPTATSSPTKSLAALTKADLSFVKPIKSPRCLYAFPPVQGGAGSADTSPRYSRLSLPKFYTDEGIFDLVGNNTPVFFIRDAMKFPRLCPRREA